MSESVKAGVCPVALLSGAIALAGLSLSLAAQAAEAPRAQAQTQTQATAPDAQVVVRDADTGTLRAPTSDELEALKKSAQSSKAKTLLRAAPARTMQPYDHFRTGARGVRLTEDFMTYSVVVKQPDGSLKEMEVQGREAAAKATATQPRNTLPTE